MASKCSLMAGLCVFAANGFSRKSLLQAVGLCRCSGHAQADSIGTSSNSELAGSERLERKT